MTTMASCSICSDPRIKEINRWLLTGRQMSVTAKEFGFNALTMAYHRRKHLPYRNSRLPKPVTVQEHLAQIQYELQRLTILGECGERGVHAACIALRERRYVLELQARMGGHLDGTHKKRFLEPREVEGEYEVVFEGGRPRTVAKKVVS
jgi:hypothetical protein